MVELCDHRPDMHEYVLEARIQHPTQCQVQSDGKQWRCGLQETLQHFMVAVSMVPRIRCMTTRVDTTFMAAILKAPLTLSSAGDNLFMW